VSAWNSIFKSALRRCGTCRVKGPQSRAEKGTTLQNHNRGDIAETSARSPSTGSGWWKAMLSSAGAAINTSHVTLIAATSNR
jgi:hypothetical protein